MAQTLEEILSRGFEAMEITPEENAIGRLRTYYDYLGEMNKVMNLTAISGEEDSARLHFLDCASLLTLPEFKGGRIIDVGTGAGFPGLVLKIMRPELDLTLLDSLDKRIGFLNNTCEKLGLADVKTVHARAEEAPKEFRAAFDAATSRAVAKLNILCELCLPLVKKGGVFIAMKGPDCAEELKEARHAIVLLGGSVERVEEFFIPGTDIKHSLIIIRKTSDTAAKYPRRWAQIKKSPL